MRTVLAPVFLLLMSFVMACGGSSSSGGGDGDVVIDGVVDDGASNFLQNIEVCALGACDRTNSNGAFSLGIKRSDFNGGDVAFVFNGEGLSTTSVVNSLSPSSTLIFVQFSFQNGQVVPVAVTENDTSTTPPPADNNYDDADEDDGAVNSACQIINNTRIDVVNSTPTVQHSVANSACPNMLGSILTVNNPGSTAYSYEITVDLADIAVQPISGVLAPGQSAQHNVAFLCTGTTTFDTLINATVTSISSETNSQITREEVLNDCGPSAEIGNLTDRESITVQVTQ